MSILCEPTARAVELSPSIGGEVAAADSLAVAAELLDADPTETLVVIGGAIPTDDALAFSAALRLARPAVGMILLREQVDVSLLIRALQCGVREVIPAGDPAALSAACGRFREVSRQVVIHAPVVVTPEPSREGQIVTVFSAKGGVGKTTLAVNVGVALAEGAGQRVCVVDLDLAFGDVAISVQLDPARNLVDALPMAGHLDPTGAASLLTNYRPGLDMLLAPVTPGDAEKVPATLVTEMLGVLRGMFDFVVVDTPSQVNEHVLAALDASAHHVLLTTPDVAALKNLRITLDILDMLSYPAETRSVVLNRSGSKVGLTVDDVQRVVRCSVAAQIPSSRAVPLSINHGTPIMLALPGHPVSQAITRFAQQRLHAAPARRKSRSRSGAKRRTA